MTKEEIGIKAMKFIDEHETDCFTGFEWMREFAYEVTKELEKENGELKEKLLTEQRLTTMQDETVVTMINRLIKAKEIIKKYLVIGVGGKITQNYLDVTKEAEQFLKDSDIDGAIQQVNEGLDFDKIADEMEQDLKDSEVEK